MPSNTVKFYKDEAGRWRWTAYAGNGRKVGREAEGDGYDSERDARRGYEAAVTAGEVEDVENEPGMSSEPSTFTKAPDDPDSR